MNPSFTLCILLSFLFSSISFLPLYPLHFLLFLPSPLPSPFLVDNENSSSSFIHRYIDKKLNGSFLVQAIGRICRKVPVSTLFLPSPLRSPFPSICLFLHFLLSSFLDYPLLLFLSCFLFPYRSLPFNMTTAPMISVPPLVFPSSPIPFLLFHSHFYLFSSSFIFVCSFFNRGDPLGGGKEKN